MKTYAFHAYQNGDTSNPVIHALHNDLHSSPVWTRISAGQYVGTLAGAFAVEEFWQFWSSHGSGYVRITDLSDRSAWVQLARVDANSVSITMLDDSLDPYDGGFSLSMELRIYP